MYPYPYDIAKHGLKYTITKGEQVGDYIWFKIERGFSVDIQVYTQAYETMDLEELHELLIQVYWDRRDKYEHPLTYDY